MKAYLIHGGERNPDDCWFPWLKKELSKKGYLVIVPSMPSGLDIDSWIEKLKDVIKPNNKTILVGYSRGCQAILRFLQVTDYVFDGVFFVAGYTNIYLDDHKAREIKKWLKVPIQWNKVRKQSKNFVALFSDNDPIVDLSNAEVFKDKLNAKIIIDHNKGHFDNEAGITKLPSLLKEINSLK